MVFFSKEVTKLCIYIPVIYISNAEEFLFKSFNGEGEVLIKINIALNLPYFSENINNLKLRI